LRINVLKFGGSTFRSTADYPRVAAYIRRRLDAAEKIVIVASAMAGLTERLREQANAIGVPVDPQASDALLPLADTASAAMLSMALRHRGVRSVMLDAHQLGIITDARHTRARVLSVDAAPLHAAFQKAQCVVVPGAQGVTADDVPTSLGKNTSDLTAVLLAAALRIGRCEVFSDACGVYSGDPNLLRDVRLIERISHGRLYEIALSGAKVMHHGAVEAAARAGVELVCRLNRDDYRVGTIVLPAVSFEQPAVVLDMRATLLRFASDDLAARAALELNEFGVPTIGLAGVRERALAVTCGFFDPVAFLRERGLACKKLDGRLITELFAARQVRRHVASDELARETAQRLHDLQNFRADIADRDAVTALAAV
jgi:aspartate kinase